MLCRQRPDLSDLSIRTQEGILVKNSKNISIKELIAEKAIYLVFIILLVAIVVVEPRFLSFNNFKNIFAQSSTKIIIALAAGMVLVVQGVDLSTGRMIGLAAVIFASLVQNPDYAYRMYPNLKELPLIVPLLLVLAICLVLGGISGVAAFFCSITRSKVFVENSILPVYNVCRTTRRPPCGCWCDDCI